MILTNYYYIIGTKNYLLKQEPLEEILRERSNHYLKNRKNIDFWIINDLYKIEKGTISTEENKTIFENPHNYVLILSTNKSFINWLKLRFDNTLKGKFQRSINLIKN